MIYQRGFHNEDAEQVMTWIKTLVDTKQPIVWVTFHQLLVDFQIQTERIGLRFQGKQWYATTEDATYSYKKTRCVVLQIHARHRVCSCFTTEDTAMQAEQSRFEFSGAAQFRFTLRMTG